jgi:hypothetical protein
MSEYEWVQLELLEKIKALPRYSFLSPLEGGVRRYKDSSGAWIERYEVIKLLDEMLEAAPTPESITIPIAEYEAIKPSKMALDCIAKMVADEMEKCVKNGANSISMPDELVAVAMWLCDMEKYIDKAKEI